MVCLDSVNEKSKTFNGRIIEQVLSFSDKVQPTNTIFHGDCLTILQKMQANSVDLIYLDPPFFANRYFEVSSNSESRGFDDRWKNGIWQYLDWMRSRLKECHRVLKKTGSLYLHCDSHASHYLKVELDMIFGYNKMRNEIIWKRHNAHNDGKQGAKSLGKVHDTIFLYSKSRRYTWNMIYKPYDDEYVRKFYRHVEPETGRRYALGDLSGPGGKAKGNPYYTFKGITRYWRYGSERMAQLDKEGRILQRREGTVPVLKRYLDEMKGIPLQDIWENIRSVTAGSKEAVGYPTQKPLELLERIIRLSSNEGDVVLDPFCGCGTSLIAAQKLGRKWIGIDVNESACNVAKRRLATYNIDINLIEVSTPENAIVPVSHVNPIAYPHAAEISLRRRIQIPAFREPV